MEQSCVPWSGGRSSSRLRTFQPTQDFSVRRSRHLGGAPATDDDDDDDDDDKVDNYQKRTKEKEHELSRLVSQQLTVNKREYV